MNSLIYYLLRVDVQSCNQYRLVMRRITCNYWLHIVKIKNLPLCAFCSEYDTTEHFLSVLRPYKAFLENIEITVE